MPADLYTEFLRLPPGPRPPDHYTILGLPLFEAKIPAIHEAVLRQTAELKRWAIHPDRATRDRVQEMLNEVNRAGFILEDRRTKAKYDRELAQQYGVSIADVRGAESVSGISILPPSRTPQEAAPTRTAVPPSGDSALLVPPPESPEPPPPPSADSPDRVDLMVAEPASAVIQPAPSGDRSPGVAPPAGPSLGRRPTTGHGTAAAPGADAALAPRAADTAPVSAPLRGSPRPVQTAAAAAPAERQDDSDSGSGRPSGRPLLGLLAASAAAGIVAAGALIFFLTVIGPGLAPPPARPGTSVSAGNSSPPTSAPRPAPGTIALAGLPDGATVWLDGREVGKAEAGRDFMLAPVPAGQHVIKAARDGYGISERKVTVEPGRAVGLAMPAQPPPRLIWQKLWAAVAAGDEPAFLACFSRNAQGLIAQTEMFTASHAKDLPEPLRGLTFAELLAREADRGKAKTEIADERVAGDRASLEVRGPWGIRTFFFVREDGAWKVGLPLLELDRLKSGAEAAVREKRADEAVAGKARQEAEERERAAAKKVLEDFWAAAAAGDRLALLLCLDAAARQEAIAIDDRIAELSQQTPKLAEMRLVPALARRVREAKIGYGETKLAGSKATLEATINLQRDLILLVKDGAAWKIASPFPEFARISTRADAVAAAAAALDAVEYQALQAKVRDIKALRFYEDAMAECRWFIAKHQGEPLGTAASKDLDALRREVAGICDQHFGQFRKAIEQGDLQAAKQATDALARYDARETRLALAGMLAQLKTAEAKRAAASKVYTAWPFDAAEAKRRQEESARALGVKTEEDVDLGGGVRLTMVLIPAGEFMMGSPPGEAGRKPDEDLHRLRIDRPFWIGKHEVTQEQWQAVMGSNPSAFKWAWQPVECVSWNDVQAFLQRLNARVVGGGFGLPTEAQWEYACRAGSSTRFCFGDEDSQLGGYAWYEGNSQKTTHPVGQKNANNWGLRDMHGNVWEWCASTYVERYNGREREDLGIPGPSFVLRGGSWYRDAGSCRSAERNGYGPEARNNTLGFRVARCAKAPEAAPTGQGVGYPGGDLPPPKVLITHVVAKGDTYRKLAHQYYRDESKWEQIAKANGVPQSSLRVGQKIVIPVPNPER